MSRRTRVLFGAVALALIGALAGRTQSLAFASCAPAAAKTVAVAGGARLYVRGGALYGCLGTRRTLLGGAPGARRLGATHIARYALAPRYVALDTAAMGVDTLNSSVSVVDLARGATLASAPATTPEDRAESFIGVTAIAIDRHGTAAWIGSRSAVGAFTPVYEVHTLGAAGKGRLLASGGDIAPSSLRLSGQRLSWRRGAREHAATISP